MILHVGSISAFIGPLKKLIRSEFPQQDHRYWLTASTDNHGIETAPDVYIGDSNFWGACRAHANLVCQLHSARKVILHGLFEPGVVVLLALMPWLLPKCYWVVWGGDLYQYKASGKSWRSRFKELFRRFVIKRVGHLVTYIEGDVELARQWYGAKGTHHECIMYLSNVVDPGMTLEEAPDPDRNGLNILLGNSADPTNNHIEALERLLLYKDKDIKIYAPLSYGDQNHAKKVTAQGRAWFGDKFVPMTDFMPYEQYLEFLKSLDIAIFNHQRQQAMGNTITLLGMGKTVFMRSDVSHWRFLNSLGIKLRDVADLTFEPVEVNEAQENARIVQSYFSRTNLVSQLRGVLSR